MKHSKRTIYSFILMLLFGIAFCMIGIFNNALEEEILNPAIQTSLELFALSDSAQSARLIASGEESAPASKLYYQINSSFNGENCVYNGIVTVKYQFSSDAGGHNETLKSAYLKCDAGKALLSDSFIINVPEDDGEMILTIEGVGSINDQEVSFIQTVSVFVSGGAVKINKMPEDAALQYTPAAKTAFGQNLVILSFLIFLLSAGNYLWCMSEEKNGKFNLKYRLNAVPIEKPVNLLKVNLIRLDNAKDLADIARKRNKEILIYVFSAKLSYYYVITNEITYLYVHDLKADMPKSNRKSVKKDVLRTSQKS